ncbi:MAG TPA: hypothetical protein VFH88_08100 [Candidatus Krumholzibacteria bacterium]|nr:hypothetical protein [Candidatus Krumholzibacteria bacterium]
MFAHIRLLLISLLLCLPAAALAQKNGPPPIPPETDQFNFWLGDWDAAMGGDAHGSNHITKRWDRVIVEEFNGAPGSPLEGHSVSVFDPNSKLWKQTWVDNQGAYLDFTGTFQEDRMILSRAFEKNGKTIHQRMVWYNIKPDSFDWNWERSLDDGKTWEVMWQIRYTRKK